MPIIETHYTPEQLAKVPAGPYKFIDATNLPDILKGSTRVYGLADIPQGEGKPDSLQIVRINGARDIERYQLHAVWISGTTIADLVRPA